MPRADDYLQIADAAQMLGVCQNTLRNWGRTGKVTEYRHPVNNYRLYKQAELEVMVRQIKAPEVASVSRAKTDGRGHRRKPR